MKLGIIAGYSGRKFSISIDSIKHAENLGYESIWTAEAYGSDAVTPAAWILAQTDGQCWRSSVNIKGHQYSAESLKRHVHAELRPLPFDAGPPSGPVTEAVHDGVLDPLLEEARVIQLRVLRLGIGYRRARIRNRRFMVGNFIR